MDEIPAYAPAGEGEHFFVRVRKRDLTTDLARRLLADAAGVDPRAVGVAGRKDRHAVTTQWFSLPIEPADPGDARLELIERHRHPRKLRMGHLRGNRFEINLVDLHPAAADRLPALLSTIAGGIPSYFGPQRFGREGASIAQAWRMVQTRRRSRDDRFLATVLQSVVFNHWLARRVADGLLHLAVEGDILRKRQTGGLFTCADPSTDTTRVAGGEVDPTGPMFGPKMMEPTGPALEREAAALAAASIDERALRRLARLAPGTRRLARIVPADLRVEITGASARVSFSLPAGAFATVVLDELTHTEGDLRRPPGEDPGAGLEPGGRCA